MDSVVKRVRHAAVAGQFYKGYSKYLIEQIEDCYLHPEGPGELPTINPSGPGRLRGLVVPHAGYIYSGAVAAHAYHALANDGLPGTFVILGPNHTGLGTGVALTTDDFEMILGPARVDKELAAAFHTSETIIDNDPEAHKYEHSIEVQLPFLQHLSKDFTFVPISMYLQSYETAVEVGNTIGKILRQRQCQRQRQHQHQGDLDRNTVIIASSDFTHCGDMYGQPIPYGQSAAEYAAAQDRLALDALRTFSPKRFLETIQLHNVTVCGYGPIMTMMVAAKILGARTVEILKYATSAQFEHNPGPDAVGYAAVAFST